MAFDRLAFLRTALALAGRIALFAALFLFTLFVLTVPHAWVRDAMPAWPGHELAYGLAASLAAALAATALCLALLEDGTLPDIGLRWTAAGRWNLGLGVAAGAGSGCLVTVIPVLLGAGEWRAAAAPAGAGGFLFLALVLTVGVAAEELQLRGYVFQVLMRTLGPAPTIVLTGALFAAGHAGNPNVTPAGLANTFLAGVGLGCAFWRSRDLWLPMGIHLGWNLVLPAFGASLSGFALQATGIEIAWRISPLWSGGSYGPEAGLLTTLAFLCWLLVLWKAPIRRQAAFLLERYNGGPTKERPSS